MVTLEIQTRQRDQFINIDSLLEQFHDTAEVIVLVGHGGLYRCMLPVVLGNVSPEFARKFVLPHSGQVVAEPSAGGLVCVSWWESDAPRAPFAAA